MSQEISEILVYGQQEKIFSKVLNEERTILITLPKDYDSSEKKRYPVFYNLDGRTQFQHVVGTLGWLSGPARKMPQHIIVSIYNTKRFRDFSPSVPKNFKLLFPDNPPGGADNFTRFLSEELIPYIDKKFNTTGVRTLAGHSFGGLLALHVMLTQKDLFQAYIAMSPNVKYDNMELVERAAKTLKASDNLAAILFLSVGNEADLKPGYDKLVSILTAQAPKGLTWESQVYLDEDHMSIPSRTLHNAMMAISADFGWRIKPELGNKGIDAVKSHYQDLTKRFGYKIVPPEQEVNKIGYGLLQQKKLKEAIDVFVLNTQFHPESANAFDSLADGFEAIEKWSSAKEVMMSAVKLASKQKSPDLGYFEKHLQKVEEKMLAVNTLN
jgi:predicted alpha/beta superfamily hydrolase